ncbi:MAG: hypothetical protein AB7N80_14655 [Bdellovibrionales bacterium]
MKPAFCILLLFAFQTSYAVEVPCKQELARAQRLKLKGEAEVFDATISASATDIKKIDTAWEKLGESVHNARYLRTYLRYDLDMDELKRPRLLTPEKRLAMIKKLEEIERTLPDDWQTLTKGVPNAPVFGLKNQLERDLPNANRKGSYYQYPAPYEQKIVFFRDQLKNQVQYVDYLSSASATISHNPVVVAIDTKTCQATANWKAVCRRLRQLKTDTQFKVSDYRSNPKYRRQMDREFQRVMGRCKEAGGHVIVMGMVKDTAVRKEWTGLDALDVSMKADAPDERTLFCRCASERMGQMDSFAKRCDDQITPDGKQLLQEIGGLTTSRETYNHLALNLKPKSGLVTTFCDVFAPTDQNIEALDQPRRPPGAAR